MALSRLATNLAAGLVLASVVSSQNPSQGNLVLCDCGIGDDKEHPDWSTSRQMNWYNQIKWPDSASTYPKAPDMAVQVPYKDGIYPWLPQGVTAAMPNGEVWTAYIEDGTPDGFKAGSAVSSKDSKAVLNCWAYRGRPISAAINKTVSHDAICRTAFVCNHEINPPARPKDMNPHSSATSSPATPPRTTFYTKPPPTTVTVTPTSSGQPAPTHNPNQGKLDVFASVNPRFINWQDTWQAFINMTLLLIKALRDVGLNSLWFNQNPVIPGGSSSNQTLPNWVVMPEAFSLQAIDVATNHVVGRLSYKTHYDVFLSTPCSTCETGRFNKSFFDQVIGAVQGSYPRFNNFTVQAQCDPWMACE